MTARNEQHHVNLMLPADLHVRVSAKARKNDASVVNTIRRMITDWLSQTEDISFADLHSDLAVAWGALAPASGGWSLKEEIIEALRTAQTLEDMARIRFLAELSVKIRSDREQRERKHLQRRDVHHEQPLRSGIETTAR